MMNSQRVTGPPALLSIGALGLGFLKNHRRGGGSRFSCKNGWWWWCGGGAYRRVALNLHTVIPHTKSGVAQSY